MMRFSHAVGGEEKDSKLPSKLPPRKLIICGNNETYCQYLSCRLLAYVIEFVACAVIARFSGSSDCIAAGRC